MTIILQYVVPSIKKGSAESVVNVAAHDSSIPSAFKIQCCVQALIIKVKLNIKPILSGVVVYVISLSFSH